MPELTTSDRLAIGELLARYSHCIDRARWDDFKTLFTADCRLDLSQVMGLYEGAEGIARFCDTMRSLPIVMRHFLTNLVVVEGDGERARVESYVLAITGPAGGPSTQMPGFYDDEVVKQGGRWLLRSRRLALDVPAS
ncbi:MAG TPA: nuclear transport factor 2 family protein [Candidatus Binatia bacterium]|nr:nuclear transport factor 2 family protein [Candidatus Binatia bacterium]